MLSFLLCLKMSFHAEFVDFMQKIACRPLYMLLYSPIFDS